MQDDWRPSGPTASAGGTPGSSKPSQPTLGDAARQWAQVRDAAESALQLSVEARPEYVASLGGPDSEFRQAVERLVQACESVQHSGHFLAEPAPVFANAVIADVIRSESERASALHAEIPFVLGEALAGRYAIERELGRGGMATVYLARDERHGRPVAIKVVHPDLSPLRGYERFVQEIEIAAKLQHPHILPLFDSGAAARLLYYVMPYVAGESLRQRLSERERLATRDAIQLIRELADALAYAHDQGVVHRDLKPENILLSRGHALVADFGIAKALAAAVGTTAAQGVTSTGMVPGTPGYMAPEQRNGAPADQRSDLFALGVVAYEMLAGHRPHHQPVTNEAQAIIRAREDVPPPVAMLVAQLLAPHPADRPQSAHEVVRILDSLVTSPIRQKTAWRRARSAKTVGFIALAVALIVSVWNAVTPSSTPLDLNRVVIFPLDATGADLAAGTGEDVATLLGHALEGTAPLRWLEATDYLSAQQRSDVRRVGADERRAISQRKGAAFYIDGSVVRQADSVFVRLRLHSVPGDSLLASRDTSGHALAVTAPQLGIRAVPALLVALIERGRRVDVSTISTRKPAALVSFLQGERDYRASRFASALAHYNAALATDSLFAVAALKGAQAASWLDRSAEALQLAELSLRQAKTLPPHRVAMIRGLRYYLHGAADSAVAQFKQVIAYDSLASEPWMALGDTYRHLLPSAVGLDSLAEHAFARSRQNDPEFTPPLFHLAELALRRGAVALADTLTRQYVRAFPDSIVHRPIELMLRCAQHGDHAMHWDSVVADAPMAVLEAGVLLAAGAAYPACGRGALWAIVQNATLSEGDRYAALLGLESLLAATGRDAEIVGLFESPAAVALKADGLLLLYASDNPAVQARAAQIANQYGEQYSTLSSYKLWLLGCWEFRFGSRERARAIASALAAKADLSHGSRDSLFARMLTARVGLASADTAATLRALQGFVPRVPYDALFWSQWDGMGSERLLLAQMLLAQKNPRDAERVAAQLDDAKPVVNMLYLRPSLLLRAQAADAAGDTRRAARIRARLAVLDRDTAVVPWSKPSNAAHAATANRSIR